MSIRHIVLDRDGVLNEEAPEHGYIREPGDFRWLPGVLPSLNGLHGAGVRLSVASNQSGVGRGLMSIAQMESVNAFMRQQARDHGAVLDAVFCCPHAPDAGCGCRKPLPGLIEAAIAQARIPPAETLLVGDDWRDLEAGQRAGVAVALVLTGKGPAHADAARACGIAVYRDLPEVMRAVLNIPLG